MELITLKNKNKHKIIEDVLLYPLKVNIDETGGTLVETLRRDWKDIYGPDRQFHMQYFSVTPTGVARDEKVWHLHYGQEDRFLLAQGEVVVAVADFRKESKTNGLLNLFLINSIEDPYVVLIPKGTLHGFMVVSKENAILINFPTALYNPDDELRIPYREANIKLASDKPFSWDIVREKFPKLSKPSYDN